MSLNLDYDAAYWKSISAILKICCLFSTLIGFLCIVCSGVPLHNLRGSFFMAVTILAFTSTSCLLLAGVFQLWPSKLNSSTTTTTTMTTNASRIQMFLNGFLAFCTFVAAAVACSLDVLAYSIATFFEFFAACIYAYEAYLGFCLSRKCNVATQTQATI